MTISGVVTDETAVRHVMVYAGKNKLFFAGSGKTPVRSVPFTADVPLEAGQNTITILAEDEDGITVTRSVVTYYVGPENRAIAGNLLDKPTTP